MASEIPSVPLSSGQHMPIVGLGTWQTDDESSMREVLEAALDAGYRHIDTAFAYNNEKCIGKVLDSFFKDGKVKREELFIVSKLPSHGLRPDSVEHFFNLSLNELQLTYVDLYLIHTPVATKRSENDREIAGVKDGDPIVDDVDIVETWRVMESLVDKGLVKAIGLSNCNSKQVQRIYDAARIKPSNLQVECHAYLPQYELFEFCQKLGISLTAYAPLGSPSLKDFFCEKMGLIIDSPNLLEDENLKAVIQKHKKTPAQILLKYLVQRGITVIPKSKTPSRIKENIQIFDFSLDEDDMKVLKSMASGFRFFTLGIYSSIKNHPEFPFGIPF